MGCDTGCGHRIRGCGRGLDRPLGRRRARSFASAVTDPLAFEREYLSMLTGETITRVRPDPTITISFDGDGARSAHDGSRPATRWIAYVTERGSGAGSGVLLQLSGGLAFEDLRNLLGPDGSIQPEETPPPKGLEVLAFAAPLAEATTSGPVVVGACVTGGEGVSPARVWLTAPVEVTPLEG
jgi:hypothetical protein